MSNLMNFNYNGQVIQKREDGFISLTQMCHANGKLLANWKQLKSTDAYLKAVSSDIGIPMSQLLEVRKGNSSDFNQGTWGHPMVAIHLAQWLSPKFYSWCNAHIFNLMQSGSTSLEIDPLEEMRLKVELARLENQKAQAELGLVRFRHTVVETCPEPIQQKILGYQTVEKIEYRDRIIQEEEVIRDGSTVNKTELCHRYGIVTRNGKPDYKTLNKMLSHLPENAWDEQMTVRTNKEIKRSFLPTLDFLLTEGNSRQLFLGE